MYIKKCMYNNKKQLTSSYSLHINHPNILCQKHTKLTAKTEVSATCKPSCLSSPKNCYVLKCFLIFFPQWEGLWRLFSITCDEVYLSVKYERDMMR